MIYPAPMCQDCGRTMDLKRKRKLRAGNYYRDGRTNHYTVELGDYWCAGCQGMLREGVSGHHIWLSGLFLSKAVRS